MLDRMNKSVVDNDLLDEREAEREQLRAQLEKFLTWNKKWPKTAAVMDVSAVADMEIELDNIMQETETILQGSVVPMARSA